MRVLDDDALDQVAGGIRFIATSYPLQRGEKLEIIWGGGVVGPSPRQIEINRLRAAGNTDPSALADALGY